MCPRQGRPRVDLVTYPKILSLDDMAQVRVRTFTCYAMTYSAYCTDSTYARMRQTMEAIVQLEADEAWSSRLYTHLQQMTGTDVDLATIEATFQFRWTIVTDGTLTLDPYFSRVLDEGITTSFGRMLGNLEAACRSLPGIDPGEASYHQDHKAICACNLLYNRIAPLLVDSTCTPQRLLDVTRQAHDELISAAAAAARERVEYQATGVRALQRLCAAVRENYESVAVLIQSEREAIGYLVQNPPPMFSKELVANGVPLAEMRAYLYPEGRPLSGAVLEMSIGRWALTYYDALSSACILSLDALRVLSRTTCNWNGFSGIALWHNERNRELIETAMETGGFGAAVPFPDVEHVHAFTDYALVATATAEPTAPRVVRLAGMVKEIVSTGLIRPRSVRAEHVLGLVGRFGCEALVERNLRLDDEAMHGMQIDKPTAMSSAYPIVPLPQVLRPLHGVTHTPLKVALHAAADVTKCLQRDYVLIAVIRDVLSQCHYARLRGLDSDEEPEAVMERGYVGITQVSDLLNSLQNMGESVQTMIDSISRQSLTMTLGHLMKDKIAKTVAEVQYMDMPSWIKGSKGLRFTRLSGRLLSEYLDGVVLKMQPPTGATFANEWHTSRSSKSHARRKAGGTNGTNGTNTAEASGSGRRGRLSVTRAA